MTRSSVEAEDTGPHGFDQLVPDPADASLLELDERTAALSMRRLGCMRSRPIEIRRTLIRGDRFSVSARFSPSEGYTFVTADSLALS